VKECQICGKDFSQSGSLYKVGYHVGNRRESDAIYNPEREVQVFGHFDSRGSFISDFEGSLESISFLSNVVIQCSVCKVEIKLAKLIRWAIELPLEELPLNLNHSHIFIERIILFRIEHPDRIIGNLQMFVYEIMIRGIV
jgi:hypothetical protein